ncbi:hypothetical protein J6590_061803 [Homalodisca vitripennis]|nr:hypothetical protein J6590_061803 [Homalodisca vitripennis]
MLFNNEAQLQNRQAGLVAAGSSGSNFPYHRSLLDYLKQVPQLHYISAVTESSG